MRFLSQFADPLVGALLVAAVVAAAVAVTERTHGGGIAQFGDTIAILLIVLLNAALGFIQERRAEAALEALERMAAHSAKVRRGGKLEEVPAHDLVPGDLVELEAGDAVPADVRLVSTSNFATSEAALTGESTPVHKSATADIDEHVPVADRGTMAYMGTAAAIGRARAIVVATGADTEIGRIGAMIREAGRMPTPLEMRLARFGKVILLICIGLSAALFAIGMVRGQESWTLLLLTAVSLAVAAIPEGLPAITTITLALGMQRMAHRGAIVRKLPAVETLGSATVICSDKTGTLTQNAMNVRAVDTPEASLRVTGTGYEPSGAFAHNDDLLQTLPEPVQRLVRSAVICNTSQLVEKDGQWTVIGDPTEGALLALGRRADIDRDVLFESLEQVREVPFASDRRRMSIVVRWPDGHRTAHVKGSPDVILPRCTRVLTNEGERPLDDAERQRLLEINAHRAESAYRVLAIAERPYPDDGADPEADLTFLGFVSMIDPPRDGVREAVAECRSAGIRVVMITGDHKLTAVAIASDLQFWDADSVAVSGDELDAMSEAELDRSIAHASVFARVTAEQKLRIVRAFIRNGHVVAVTGDGVNDAPALREAPIGVAMGQSGTDVAREAAAMVLADDNFATIVHAIREGRAIFRNIRKFIFFLNSSNAGLVTAVIVGSFFAWMPPLTPLQLLWINLVTNGLPALALGVDPPDASQMQERPTPRKAGLVGTRDLVGILLVGAIMGMSAVGLYFLADFLPHIFRSTHHAGRLAEARSMAFTLLAISPLFHAHNCRSETRSILQVGLFSNPYLWAAIGVSATVHLVTILVPPLHTVFHTHWLTGPQWAVVLALAFVPVPVFELIKAVERALRR